MVKNLTPIFIKLTRCGWTVIARITKQIATGMFVRYIIKGLNLKKKKNQDVISIDLMLHQQGQIGIPSVNILLTALDLQS